MRTLENVSEKNDPASGSEQKKIKNVKLKLKFVTQRPKKYLMKKTFFLVFDQLTPKVYPESFRGVSFGGL